MTEPSDTADIGQSDLGRGDHDRGDLGRGERGPAERRLMNKAVHYLGRYTASRQRLREVLGRFADRKLAEHDADIVAAARERVIDDCVRLGYVDDASFALSQARGKRRAGQSRLAIQRALGVHALDDTVIDQALADADEGISDGELAAALRHAARRRLGPYARNDVDQPTRQRHLASFAHAGFSLAIARQVMDLDSDDEADTLAGELRAPIR